MKKLFLIVLLFPFFGIIPPCTFAEMIGTNFVRLMGKSCTGGTYENLETGYLDWCGINYFSPEQMQQIIKRLREEKPKDYHLLLTWLEQGTPV